MKACIFGAGAIGGQLAMRLARGGAEVSMVARGEHLDAIRRDGLRIVLADGEWSERLPATDDPRELGPQDVVVVTVKQPALPEVARTIAPLLGPDTPVAFVMNGIPWWYFHGHGGPREGQRLDAIDPGSAIWNAVGPERAIGGVVYSAAEVVEPGVIHVENANGRLILGEPNGADSARVRDLAALINAGGLNTAVSTTIRDEVWTKLINNIASGTLAVLAQTTASGVYAEPACEAAARTVYAELMKVAATLGARPSLDPDRNVARSKALHHKPSILQDLERGRPMEVASMFEAPLAMARIAGVPAPMTDLLVTLAVLRARAAGLYPAKDKAVVPKLLH
ncbi:ketopantoate reductase family protein [Faunimonas sp. B44]|uniref:ketopantoate reductase family protein n=1 Tax=Faunimonas sp. B44 TaxID=3461493 RepID=UPI00404423BC